MGNKTGYGVVIEDVQPRLGVRLKRELKRNKILYLMAIPVILYFAIFCYGPMIGLTIAFKDYQVAKGIFGSSWVGFKYFIEFFQSVYFKRVMTNTLLISVYTLLFSFPAPIIFALLLNEMGGKYIKKSVQTISYLPHFISMVVVCGMITDFFSTNGVITRFITFFGGEKMNYLGVAKYFRKIYVVTNIWETIGWESIIFFAALSGINQELYEAATIDGAKRFQQVLHITLPGIASTIIVMLIMRVGQLLNIGYEKIILLYSPATYETADVISSFVYRYGIEQGSRYGYSTAVGLFQSVVNLILLLVTNAISRKISDVGLF